MTFQSDFITALRNQAPLDGAHIAAGLAASKMRFNVYRNNLAVGLRDALRNAFPNLRKVLGDNNFDLIAREYSKAHLPKSPIMAEYGAEMPRFVAGFAALSDLPYLPDIARIDQGLRRAYHAADHTPIKADIILAAQNDGKLTLAPSVQVIQSAYPLFDIYQTVQGHRDALPRALPQDVMILRPEFDPFVHPLPKGGAKYLEALVETGSISDAFLATDDLDESDFQTLFAALLEHQAIILRNDPIHLNPDRSQK